MKINNLINSPKFWQYVIYIGLFLGVTAPATLGISNRLFYKSQKKAYDKEKQEYCENHPGFNPDRYPVLRTDPVDNMCSAGIIALAQLGMSAACIGFGHAIRELIRAERREISEPNQEDESQNCGFSNIDAAFTPIGRIIGPDGQGR